MNLTEAVHTITLMRDIGLLYNNNSPIICLTTLCTQLSFLRASSAHFLYLVHFIPHLLMIFRLFIAFTLLLIEISFILLIWAFLFHKFSNLPPPP